KLAGPVAILVLVGILAVISASRYHAVAKVLALAALAQGGLYLIFKSLPGMLDPLMSAAQLGSFSPPLARLIQAISGDISGRFGWVGIGLLAAAVAVWLLGVMVGFSRRFIMPNPVEVRPTAGDRLRLN
ncbi:MAG TPA: hypothetical protein VK963_00005, partial [Candidatus Saccharimonadales bacterium]|nr:hypothetical protein [Candidatus Saccharimonadales bacterium]